MYDTDGFLVDSPVKRNAIGPSHPPLVKRSDGWIVVVIRHDAPSEPGVSWLPAPTGGFRLNLRFYEPAKRALDGACSAAAGPRTDG